MAAVHVNMLLFVSDWLIKTHRALTSLSINVLQEGCTASMNGFTLLRSNVSFPCFPNFYYGNALKLRMMSLRGKCVASNETLSEVFFGVANSTSQPPISKAASFQTAAASCCSVL